MSKEVGAGGRFGIFLDSARHKRAVPLEGSKPLCCCVPLMDLFCSYVAPNLSIVISSEFCSDLGVNVFLVKNVYLALNGTLFKTEVSVCLSHHEDGL